MARYSSAENKRSVTVYNTFGWTSAVSTKPIPSSSRKLSPLRFAGTRRRPSAMFICQMFRGLEPAPPPGSTSPGNRHFGKSNSSHKAGLCKGLLRQHQSNFSTRRGSF